jgi:hypothetical protein
MNQLNFKTEEPRLKALGFLEQFKSARRGVSISINVIRQRVGF